MSKEHYQELLDIIKKKPPHETIALFASLILDLYEAAEIQENILIQRESTENMIVITDPKGAEKLSRVMAENNLSNQAPKDHSTVH